MYATHIPQHRIMFGYVRNIASCFICHVRNPHSATLHHVLFGVSATHTPQHCTMFCSVCPQPTLCNIAPCFVRCVRNPHSATLHHVLFGVSATHTLQHCTMFCSVCPQPTLCNIAPCFVRCVRNPHSATLHHVLFGVSATHTLQHCTMFCSVCPQPTLCNIAPCFVRCVRNSHSATLHHVLFGVSVTHTPPGPQPTTLQFTMSVFIVQHSHCLHSSQCPEFTVAAVHHYGYVHYAHSSLWPQLLSTFTMPTIHCVHNSLLVHMSADQYVHSSQCPQSMVFKALYIHNPPRQ